MLDNLVGNIDNTHKKQVKYPCYHLERLKAWEMFVNLMKEYFWTKK